MQGGDAGIILLHVLEFEKREILSRSRDLLRSGGGSQKALAADKRD